MLLEDYIFQRNSKFLHLMKLCFITIIINHLLDKKFYTNVKVYWPSPVISVRLKWKLCHLSRIYATSHRFLIWLRHYGIDQLYLCRVPKYLIWGGFQNNNLNNLCIFINMAKILYHVILNAVCFIMKLFTKISKKCKKRKAWTKILL